MAELRSSLRYWRLRREFERAVAQRTFQNCVLTYDNASLQDGMGAQLQRIFGIHALANALGASYLHSPIANLHPGDSTPNSPDAVKSLVDRCNLRFHILSNPAAVERASGCREVTVKHFRVRAAAKIVSAEESPVMFRILQPHLHIDANPSLWPKSAPVLSPVPAWRQPLRVALHVRRGDLQRAAPRRMMPIRYYSGVARRLEKLLGLAGVRARFELHTESATSFAPSSANELPRNDRTFEGTKSNEDEELDDFGLLAPLDRFVDTDPIESLERMSSADVLITSKSSFSMVAGILAPEKLVLFAPFWHSPMPGWLRTSENGSFDEVAAMRHIETMMSRA